MKVFTSEDGVKAAAESVVGAEVVGVRPLPFGNVNEVFKVESGGRAYVLKVFRHAGRPEAGKLPWVESQLTRGGVPHARMIHYTRDATHFPQGFSVCEFAAGDNCKGAVREGRLTPEAFCEHAGAFLRRVHAISVPRFGYIGDGRGTYEEFTGWLLACEVFDNLRKVDDGSRLEETLRPCFAVTSRGSSPYSSTATARRRTDCSTRKAASSSWTGTRRSRVSPSGTTRL
jgi:aminoglycoside phosphotransferase (APT) family kinase protein